MDERVVTQDDMPAVAAALLSELRDRRSNLSVASVLALSGELGAGKTTFTQALARLLGVTEDITSPTFVLEKRYATTDPDFRTLIHIDAYRLEKPEELHPLRFEETLKDTDTLIVVEWAERIASAIPMTALKITLAHESETTRRIVADL